MSPRKAAAAVPRRVQRRRGRGWRMPAGAVYVGRPTRWGNPFRISRSSDYHGLPGSWFLLDDAGGIHHPDEDTQSSARQKAVDLFAEQLAAGSNPSATEEQVRAELAGRDLVCWCPSTEPCHADVLLRVANARVAPEPVTRQDDVDADVDPESANG